MLSLKGTGSFSFLSLGSQRTKEIQIPGEHYAVREPSASQVESMTRGTEAPDLWEKTSWTSQPSLDTS